MYYDTLPRVFFDAQIFESAQRDAKVLDIGKRKITQVGNALLVLEFAALGLVSRSSELLDPDIFRPAHYRWCAR